MIQAPAMFSGDVRPRHFLLDRVLDAFLGTRRDFEGSAMPMTAPSA
jgi:hypothetical protein